MKKKTLYIDMDGVVADFRGAIKDLVPEAFDGDHNSSFKLVNEICEDNPEIFDDLKPIQDAITRVDGLFDLYDVYFLSTPMWHVPESFTSKRRWIERHFGVHAEKRLILTHRKDLNIGEFLVDDSDWHGVKEFKGTHIHFGTDKYPDWNATYTFLEDMASKPIDISKKLFTAEEIRNKLRELSPYLVKDPHFAYDKIDKWYTELKG